MATYYVDLNSGSDSNAGTSAGAPWLTMGHAANMTSNYDTVLAWGDASSADFTFAAVNLIGGADGPDDGGRAKLTAQSGGGNLVTMANPGTQIANFTLDLNGLGKAGLNMANALSAATNIEIYGINNGYRAVNANGCLMQKLYVHDNNCSLGSDIITAGSAVKSRFENNTGCTEVYAGSSSAYLCEFINNDGYAIGISSNSFVQSCLFIGQSSHGVHVTASSGNELQMGDCLFALNGGYGVNFNGTVPIGFPMDCYAYSNTSGNVSGSAGNNFYDHIKNLSVNPFVDSASDNFNFNNTAGGGAVLRAVRDFQSAA